MNNKTLQELLIDLSLIERKKAALLYKEDISLAEQKQEFFVLTDSAQKIHEYISSFFN